MKQLSLTIAIGLLIGMMATIMPVETVGMMPGFFLVAIALVSYYAVVKSYNVLGLMMLIILGLLSIGFEAYGVITCYPYGCFAYSGAMGVKIIDIVPWTVFFGWAPLVLLAWGMSKIFIEGKRSIQFILALILLVSFDLVLDPGAVHMGLWRFLESSLYYGVPWTNFFGWVLTGTIGLGIIFYRFEKRHKPDELWAMMWSGVFLLAFWSGYNIASIQWGPAVIGLAMMATFMHLKRA